ncbi:hypothetical protein BD414DRAFT_180498 [Trametes punicea]|nr:hypothetical protein BD414DRAFT_180498 [Trametes punicea]
MSRNIPQGKLDTASFRCKRMPRAMLGRVSLAYSNGAGIVLYDLLHRPVQQLKGRAPGLNEQSLLAIGLPEIQLKFCWPGYEPYDFTEIISLSGLKCNGQVAAAVACAYQMFLQKASRLQPYDDGRYAIAPNSRFSIHSLALLGLRHVYGDIFVAELELQDRGMMM